MTDVTLDPNEPGGDAPRAACASCGRAPGPKGRIRHDEFCPERTSAPRPTENHAGAERAPVRRSSRTSSVEMARQINDGIYAAQGILFGFVRPDWAADALSPEESRALSDALADEIVAHKKLRELVQKLLKGSTHGKLAFVVASIAIPRMMAHGVIPTPGAFAAPPDVVTAGERRSPPPTPPVVSTFDMAETETETPEPLPATNGHAAIPPVFARPSSG